MRVLAAVPDDWLNVAAMSHATLEPEVAVEVYPANPKPVYPALLTGPASARENCIVPPAVVTIPTGKVRCPTYP